MATYIISKRNFLEFHYAAVSVRQNRVLNAVVERNDSRVAAELVKIVGDLSLCSGATISGRKMFFERGLFGRPADSSDSRRASFSRNKRIDGLSGLEIPSSKI